MKIKQSISDAINQQINAELYSAYLYLSMAAYLDAENFSGFAHWMKKQYEEEVSHAMKMYEYLNEVGCKVTLKQIDQPPTEFASPLDCFKKSLEHEQKVTAMINNLMDIAIKENDHATRSFLNWFVDEQVEEESSVEEIIFKLELLGDRGTGIIMLDKELGSR